MSQPRSTSGIASRPDGERVIPQSRRPDGTLRPERRVREGYVPPEDVTRYKNARAESARTPAGYVVGIGVVNKDNTGPKSKASKKNEKRKAKRKEDAEGKEDEGDENDGPESAESTATSSQSHPVTAGSNTRTNGSNVEKLNGQSAATHSNTGQSSSASSHAELEKKSRALKKKLRQAQELAEKTGGGELLPEQKDKMKKIPELEKEIADLEAEMSKLAV